MCVCVKLLRMFLVIYVLISLCIDSVFSQNNIRNRQQHPNYLVSINLLLLS
uniref:Uncharacterized protein n=1 Tax=Octopus bimaculoides TaxID=37653 RepID=A0A0L8GDG6_OCTBM